MIYSFLLLLVVDAFIMDVVISIVLSLCGDFFALHLYTHVLFYVAMQCYEGQAGSGRRIRALPKRSVCLHETEHLTEHPIFEAHARE
jgi:hypothetical protein